MRSFGLSGGGASVTYNVVQAFKDIRETITELYDVNIHRYNVALLDNPEQREEARGILLRKRETLGEMARKGKQTDPDLLLNRGAAFCVYTGDIGDEFDYVMMFPNRSQLTPSIVAEEMTHGEHSCLHASMGGKHDFNAYCIRFPSLAKEFIGGLSLAYVDAETRRFGWRERGDPETFDGEDYSESANHIGHITSRHLLETARTVPYREIFHAPDQSALWDVAQAALGEGNGMRVRFSGFTKGAYKNSIRIARLSPGAPMIFIFRSGEGDATLNLRLLGSRKKKP